MGEPADETQRIERVVPPDAPAAPQAPEAASVFVTDPGGLPEGIDSPFWLALPRWGPLAPVEGYAQVVPQTELRLAHDARYLAVHVRCEEPEMDGLWARRSQGQRRLDLDDCVELLLDPYASRSFYWSVRVTPAAACEILLPGGACAQPECRVEVRKEPKAWLVLLRLPFADLGLEGDLRGTPLDGDTWGLGLLRWRREAVSGPSAGLRELSAWGAARGQPTGVLHFQGGRTARPLELARYAGGGFGVNEICVSFEKGIIPEGVEVSLRPPPAARLRSKDASRFKFRVARPGLYRYTVRIPYRPPQEPTEEEIAAIEAEAGRELSEEELADILAKRPGTPEYVAGLSFLLPDLWSEVEAMERKVGQLSEALAEDSSAFQEAAGAFRAALDSVDAFRSPHAKGKLQLELLNDLRNKFASCREVARSRLLRRGSLSIVNPYAASAGASWYVGVLRARTDHSYGTTSASEFARKLAAAGLQFVAFADRPEGGDQDGDGLHDWNGDGAVSPQARRIERSGRAVREDRGREAYVRDYSRSAAEQGKPWVAEDWKLSRPGSFVVLRAAEVGLHPSAVCIGLPAGALPAGSVETYDAVRSALSAGGAVFVCDSSANAPPELPAGLEGVEGLGAPSEVWERVLERGRRMFLFPSQVLDGKDLPEDSLPPRVELVGVLAEALTEEALVAALARGSFYVTTGPRITGVEVQGDTLTVRTKEPCQMLFRGAGGAVLGGAFGTEASYRFTGRETFVRAVCLADVLEDGFRLEATTQAFYLSDDLPPQS